MTDLIENRRKSLKITREQAADKLKVSAKTYSRKVQNKSFTADEFKELCQMFGLVIQIIQKDSVTIL